MLCTGIHTPLRLPTCIPAQSKGTYIRSIAGELGEALDSGGYLSQLRRTASGNYTVQQCLTMEQVTALLIK